MKKLSWILFAVGIYIMIDGAGSIAVYHHQPFFFDHLMRLIRMLVGLFVCYLAVKLG